MNKRCTVAVILGLGWGSVAFSQPEPDDREAAWDPLKARVEARIDDLSSLIEKAKGRGISTDYALASKEVIAAFQKATQHDHDHAEEVRRIFGTFRWKGKVDTNAAADRLAIDELNACVAVADHAIDELQKQLDGKIALTAPPDFSRGKMELKPRAYFLGGRPVFPSSLVWLPHTSEMMHAFGRLGGGFYQLTNLEKDGTVNAASLQRSLTQTKDQVAENAAPMVYLMGHAPAPWMKTQHSGIEKGARNFTRYDIDSPLIREWIQKLCAGLLPDVSKATGSQPMMHLLANEPHFATKKGGWLAQNGVSENTMAKCRQWLAKKYQTVQALNQAHGSSHTSFDAVKIEMPIDPKLRGTAVWYDWCRFNMDRVNDWFTFLKATTQANDPKHSPVTIKTLGHTLGSSDRDGGMDVEYLTNLQDVPGSDLRVVPKGATYYGKNEDGRDTATGWGSRYSYLWVDQSMVLDFTKSLCPDKVFYDSEWHGLGTVGWRDYHLSREYVRSALWLAFTHGMGAIQPWVWGRGVDGALNDKTEHIGELSTQPIAADAFARVMKELNAHADRVIAAVPKKRDFVIFYCEEAAIQNEAYMENIAEVYEALKVLNLAVGFATPSMLGKLDPKTQTVIVPPTPFIMRASWKALEAFQRPGGRVVMVGGDQSFLKNELGLPRSGDAPAAPFASIPMSTAMSMADEFDKALAKVKPAVPMETEVTNQDGAKAYGVMVRQSLNPATGGLSMVFNNVSKDPCTVLLKPRADQAGALVDVITQQPAELKFVMKPCDVRVLELADGVRKSEAAKRSSNNPRAEGASKTGRGAGAKNP